MTPAQQLPGRRVEIEGVLHPIAAPAAPAAPSGAVVGPHWAGYISPDGSKMVALEYGLFSYETYRDAAGVWVGVVEGASEVEWIVTYDLRFHDYYYQWVDGLDVYTPFTIELGRETYAFAPVAQPGGDLAYDEPDWFFAALGLPQKYHVDPWYQPAIQRTFDVEGWGEQNLTRTLPAVIPAGNTLTVRVPQQGADPDRPWAGYRMWSGTLRARAHVNGQAVGGELTIEFMQGGGGE